MKREIDATGLHEMFCHMATPGHLTHVQWQSIVDNAFPTVTEPAPNHPETPESSPNCSELPNSSEIPEACYEAAFDAAAGCTIEYRYGRRQERYWWQEAIDAAIHAYRKARPGPTIRRRNIEILMNPAEHPEMSAVIVRQICRILESAGVTVTD